MVTLYSVDVRPTSHVCFRTFLSCLPSTFGLKETDLFQPSHLYDYTDFARVLHTLSKLSNCPKAQQHSSPRGSVPGFPQQARVAAAHGGGGDDAPLVEHEEEAMGCTAMALKLSVLLSYGGSPKSLKLVLSRSEVDSKFESGLKLV